MPDVGFAQGAEDGVTDGVHQHIGIRMAFEALWMLDADPAQDQLASLGQSMNVVTDAHMNHAPTIGRGAKATKHFCRRRRSQLSSFW